MEGSAYYCHDGASMKGDRETCIDAGMDAYLAKPINRQLLQQAIEEVMARMGQALHDRRARTAKSTSQESM